MWEGFVDDTDTVTVVVNDAHTIVGYYWQGHLVFQDSVLTATALLEGLGIPFRIDSWRDLPEALPRKRVDLYATV